MTIYLNFRGDWPLTPEIMPPSSKVWRGVCDYHRYARWLCFECLWRKVER